MQAELGEAMATVALEHRRRELRPCARVRRGREKWIIREGKRTTAGRRRCGREMGSGSIGWIARGWRGALVGLGGRRSCGEGWSKGLDRVGFAGLLTAAFFSFLFLQTEIQKERAGEKGEELEKYKNILMILKMCSI